MRWLSFTLLACLTICVQTTVAPQIEVGGARPDFVVIMLVHYALHARVPHGLIACWLLGLLVGLSSLEHPAAPALIYGGAGLALWSIRELVFSKHPLTHFTLTLLTCLVVQLALRVSFTFAYGVPTSAVVLLLESLGSALYTALWAVPIHRLLIWLEKPLGLRHLRQEFSSRTGP
jgi:rod shape-determining protein MreD